MDVAFGVTMAFTMMTTLMMEKAAVRREPELKLGRFRAFFPGFELAGELAVLGQAAERYGAGFDEKQGGGEVIRGIRGEVVDEVQG
jgi:hypothetical protein